MDLDANRERLLRLLPRAARAATPRTVHKLRTSVRRLEAATPHGRLSKSWRRLRRRAGRVRDLDVQCALLLRLHLDSEAGRGAVLEAMESDRRFQAQKLRALLGPHHRRHLREKLREVAFPALEGATGLAAWTRLDARFRVLDANNLHAFRKGCKRLRYRAEAQGDTGHAASFERMQDAIGNWHDAAELARRAHRIPAAQPSLLAALDNATAARYAEALRTCAAVRPSLRSPARKPPALARRPELTASA